MVDVLIAGAGPAGALAGIHLDRAGARVLMVDRRRSRATSCAATAQPRRVRGSTGSGCGRPSRRCAAARGMLLTGNGGVHVRGTYGHGLFARALTRRVLDHCGRCRGGGRRPVPGWRAGRRAAHRRTGGVATVRGAVLCRTTAGATPLRVPAQITIAADGRRSTLAFSLGLLSHPPQPRRWAVGAYFSGLAGIETVGEMHVRGPHYIGVSPIGGEGLANVCLVTPDRDGFADPARLLERHLAADPVLGPRASAARRVTAPAILGPLAVDARAPARPAAARRRRRRLRHPMTVDCCASPCAAPSSRPRPRSRARGPRPRLRGPARRSATAAFGTKYASTAFCAAGRHAAPRQRAGRSRASGARLLRQMIRYAGDVRRVNVDPSHVWYAHGVNYQRSHCWPSSWGRGCCSRRGARAATAGPPPAGAIAPADDVYAWMRAVYPGMFVAMTAEGVLATPACSTW